MKKTILIADDNRIIRKIMVEIIKRKFSDTYNIECFEDGKSLDERLSQNLEGVCAVVTGNQMSGIKGLEIIKKHASELINRPFILHYFGDKEIGEEAKRNGAYGYVIKGDYKYRLNDVLSEALGSA